MTQSAQFRLLILSALAAAALYWAVHSLSAAGRRPEPGPPGLSGWLVYWLPEPSLEAAGAFEGALEEVSVFAYHFDERGRLTPATPWVTDTLGRLMASPRRGRVLVTVVNDVFASDGSTRMKDARCVHEAVATAESRARHIDQLMAVAALADGLEIDYENLAAEDRGPFTQLIAELAARLHAQDRRLAVVVQARLNDRAGAGAGAFDWRAIGQHADSVRLMAYYYHHGRGRPGPSAPPLWVANLHRFASSQIPPEKLVVVLSAFGFDWPDGQIGRNVNSADAQALAKKYRADPVRDPVTGTSHFEYEAGGLRHVVWFEDAESVKQKVAALRKVGVRHVGLWHLGAGQELVAAALDAAGRRRESAQ